MRPVCRTFLQPKGRAPMPAVYLGHGGTAEIRPFPGADAVRRFHNLSLTITLLSFRRLANIDPAAASFARGLKYQHQWILGLQADAVEGILRGVNFDYNRYFERRREVCGGELVVMGTRVTVRTLLASLAEGASADEIRTDFPTVTADALRAVVAFAAASAEEDMPVPPMPAAA